MLGNLAHLWSASAITPKEWTGIFTFWGLGLTWAVVSGLWGRHRKGVRLRRGVHYVDVTPTRKLKGQQARAAPKAGSGRR